MWRSENCLKWELDTHLSEGQIRRSKPGMTVYIKYMFGNTHLSEKSDSMNSRVRFLSLRKDNSNFDENNIIYLDQQNQCVCGLAGYRCLLLPVYCKGKMAHTQLDRIWEKVARTLEVVWAQCQASSVPNFTTLCPYDFREFTSFGTIGSTDMSYITKCHQKGEAGLLWTFLFEIPPCGRKMPLNSTSCIFRTLNVLVPLNKKQGKTLNMFTLELMHTKLKRDTLKK